ncbi:MAG: chorismate mutase [Oscillospiraceae bacterium]|nr:chorismate mutase [Oscillospiraceae bacterium]
MENSEKLKQLRKEIDGINRRMLELFTRRMDVSREISHVKEEMGLPTYDPERENRILERVTGETDPEYIEYTKRLFRTLMDLSKEYQEALKNEKMD